MGHRKYRVDIRENTIQKDIDFQLSFSISVSVSVDAIPFLRLVVLDVLMAVYVCRTLHPIIYHSICRGPFYRPVYGAL